MAISEPESLTAAHDVSGFSCGKPALDRWLKTRALSNQEKGFTAVMVVHEANKVVGYYGLAPTAVLPATLPRSIRTGQPPDPVPCLLLGQLAADQNYSGKGIGTGLLKHALQRFVAAASLIGGRAFIVNAVDIEACEFLEAARLYSFQRRSADVVEVYRQHCGIDRPTFRISRLNVDAASVLGRSEHTSIMRR